MLLYMLQNEWLQYKTIYTLSAEHYRLNQINDSVLPKPIHFDCHLAVVAS